MQPGDLLDLEVTGVAHGGVFVARHEGRVIFVPDAIPGERVSAVLTDTSRDAFWRADAVAVEEASPHRRAHIWRQADIDVPPAQRPGGADFGHIELAHQRALKQEVLADALRRFGRLDLPVSVEPIGAADADDGGPAGESPDGTGWRTRVSLHVDGEGVVGPFAARSHRVIPVSDLPLATDEIAAAASALRGDRPGRLDLVQPSDGLVRIIPRPERPRPTARGARRPAHRPDAAERAAHREVVRERVGDRDFRVDAGGFWQVHRLAASTLSTTVTEMLRASGGVDPEAAHLDLYGGVGLFAAAIAELGGPTTRVTSVESDTRATEHAGENLAEWTGARAETARVDRWLTGLRADASAALRARLHRGVVLLDPPRSGAGREVSAEIAALEPATIVYVACDPIALARDLAVFGEAGYRPAEVRGLDLFPNSHHVEAVAMLTR